MTPLAAPSRPSLLAMAAVFLRVGNTTFGGGDPTMAALQRELCDRRDWLRPGDYRLAYALARITPGTNMLAFCVGAAYQVAGWTGAVLGILAATVPSSVFVVLLTQGYQSFHNNPRVMAAVNGTLAAAVGLMAAASLLLIRPVWRQGSRARAIAIPTLAAAAVLWAGLSPLATIALCAAWGFIFGPEREEPIP